MLYVPEAELSRPMLSHDHRISWTWECQGILMPSWAATLAEHAGSFAPTTADSDEATDIDSLMRSGTTAAIMSDSKDIGGTYERIAPRVSDMFTPTWRRG